MGLVAAVLRAAIRGYQLFLAHFFTGSCRYLPGCSDYALEAIDKNGAWRGFWLTLSRLLRCQPWGTAGIDPVPDIRAEHHKFQPWRYGRWSNRHIKVNWQQPADE